MDILATCLLTAILNFSLCSANNAELQKLFEDYFNWKLQTYPEWASENGYKGYNDKLEDLSDHGYKMKYEKCKKFLERSKSLTGETSEYETYRLILVHEVEPCVKNHDWGKYFPPINTMGNIQSKLPKLISKMKIQSSKDFNDTLARLRAVPKMINQIIHQLNEGISHKITYARESIVLTPIVIGNIEDSPFLKPFMQTQDDFGNIEVVKKLVKHRVLPALQSLNNFLENTYRLSFIMT